MYDDEPPRRRRRSIVPVLVTIAVILAIAIAAGVVFLTFGSSLHPGSRTVSNGSPTSPASSSDATPLTPPPAGGDQATGQTDVPKAVVSVAPAGEGEPPVRSTHGDWQVRCDTPAGAKQEQCVLMQFVTAEDRDNVGLTVIILKTADKKARIMRILAPLGVLLPSGLGLKIDNADMGRAGFVRCLPNGCVAEVILEDKLLSTLRSGSTATFIIFQTPEEGIGIPISLNGFAPGYDALP